MTQSFGERSRRSRERGSNFSTSDIIDIINADRMNRTEENLSESSDTDSIRAVNGNGDRRNAGQNTNMQPSGVLANRNLSSFDDLMLLEAALLLSMEEEASRRNRGETMNTETNTNDLGNNYLGEESHANLPRLSVEEENLQRSPLFSDSPSPNANPSPNPSANPSTNVASSSLRPTNDSNSEGDEDERQVRAANRASAIRRRLLDSTRQGNLSTQLGSVSLLLRGITEEEQVAVALARSMRDVAQTDEAEDEQELTLESMEEELNSNSESLALGANVDNQRMSEELGDERLLENSNREEYLDDVGAEALDAGDFHEVDLNLEDPSGNEHIQANNPNN